jgi:hypothetical protein
MTPKELITDEDIERVHAHANFGDLRKRDVVDGALLKAACKMHNGSTANYILEKHGLVRIAYQRRPRLTDLGNKYLYAICAPALQTQHAIDLTLAAMNVDNLVPYSGTQSTVDYFVRPQDD